MERIGTNTKHRFPTRNVITTVLDENMFKKVELEVERTGLTRSELMRTILDMYFELPIKAR